MKVFNIFAIIVFVGVVGFITYSLIEDSTNEYFVTTKANWGNVEDKLTLSGFVYPSKEIEVKPQISGIVDDVFVNVGDMVHVGDPIVSVSLVPNSSEIEQLNNNVNVARIGLTAAKAVYDRQCLLLERKAISKSDFEAAEKEYLTANENYNTALKQLNLRREGSNASENIVRSSASGFIIDVPVKSGSSVMERSNYNAGSTVAIIAGVDHFVFKADVSEKNIDELSVGMPVKLTMLAINGMEIDATIAEISARGEIKGGAVRFPIEADFTIDGSAMELRSGYSATGQIILSRVTNVLTLPEKCVNFKGDTAYVYVMDSLKGHATERIVSIGISDGDVIQIKDGISASDHVITNYHD